MEERIRKLRERISGLLPGGRKGRALRGTAKDLTIQEKAVILLALEALLAAGGMLFYNTLWCMAAGVFLFWPAAAWYRKLRADQYTQRLRHGFRELLHHLAGSYATGRHLEEALAEAEREMRLTMDAGEPILQEVAVMRRQLADGEGEGAVLQAFYERSGLEEAGHFSQICTACRESGGDLPKALDQAARILGERIMTEEEIHTMISGHIAEGRMILCMPFLIVLFLRILSPGYLTPMYTTLAGRILMTVALAGMAGSAVLTERITNIAV